MLQLARRRTVGVTFWIGVLGCLVAGAIWWWLALKEREMSEALVREKALAARLCTDCEKAEYSSRASQDRSSGHPAPKLDTWAYLSVPESLRSGLQHALTQMLADSSTQPLPKLPPRPPSGPHGDFFPELMGDREYAALAVVRQRFEQEQQFAPFCDWECMDSEKRTKLVELLCESALSSYDAEQLAERHAISDVNGDTKIRNEARNQSEAAIRNLLGTEAYERMQSYRAGLNDTMGLVNKLWERLSYSESPLSSEQARRLYGFGVESRVGFTMDDATAEKLLKFTRGVLSEAQVGTLREILAEQNLGRRVEKEPTR